MRCLYFPCLVVLGAVLLFATPGHSADADSSSEPTVDLPFELLKFESSEMAGKKVQKFAELDLGSGNKARGQVVQIVYRLAPGNSPLEVIENYKQSYTDQGFKATREGASGYHAESANDGRQILLKRSDANSESFIQIDAFTIKESWKPGDARSYFGRNYKVNPEEVIALVQVVAPKAITGRMVKEDVNYILKELRSQGKVSLYGIYFDVDKTDLKPESGVVLSEVGKALSQDSNIRIKVVGHTDNTGDKSHNQSLSEGRAQAVVAALVAHGTDATRLVSEGKGDSQPVSSNDSEDGRAKNRRVELIKVG